MWNWNEDFFEKWGTSPLGINHTNVELKYEPLTNEHFMFLRINHTNVELKSALPQVYHSFTQD